MHLNVNRQTNEQTNTQKHPAGRKAQEREREKKGTKHLFQLSEPTCYQNQNEAEDEADLRQGLSSNGTERVRKPWRWLVLHSLHRVRIRWRRQIPHSLNRVRIRWRWQVLTLTTPRSNPLTIAGTNTRYTAFETADDGLYFTRPTAKWH